MINEKSLKAGSKRPGELTLSGLFKLLRVGDWVRVRYLNNRCFTELQDVLESYKAPSNATMAT